MAFVRAALVMSWALWAASAAFAGEKVITLPELLNRPWQRELVTYPFAAEKGACVADSVRLTGPGGSGNSGGPMPVQLAGVEFWPDSKFVKSATVAFVVDDLPALATQTYTVTYGPELMKAKALDSDLAVKLAADRVEATTSRFGLRLLLGEKSYSPAAAPASVPGPVLAMRLADGTWFGGSRLFGETPVAGYSARVTENGPAFVRVECVYRYADGKSNTVTIQLNAQANRAYYATRVPQGSPADGWDLLLAGLPPLAFQFMPEQGSKQEGTHAIKAWKEREISAYPAGLVSNLVPWADWTNEFTQTTLFLAFLDTRAKPAVPVPGDAAKPAAEVPQADGRELVIRRLDAGAWVTPGSGINYLQAGAPLSKAEDGTLFLRVNNKVGDRRWTLGENPSYQAKLAKAFTPNNVMQDEMEDLDVVKEMVLDWPSGGPNAGPKHPSLFLGAEDFAKAGARAPEALKKLLDLKTLRSDLGSYVFFDTMRRSAGVICLYDALIDSDQVTAQERKILRAQMAYMAYRLASPANWSPARGYNSGNPNMTVAHLVNQGLAACVLRDHPMAKEWAAAPIAAMGEWLGRIDPAGHWPESSGYARVAESKFVYFAIATDRAGLHPFLEDPRFKRMVMFYERTMTPPDPQRVAAGSPKDEPRYPRVTPPYGRGGNGHSAGIGGMVAKATEKSDPAFSRILQWSFAGSQFSDHFGEVMFGYDQLLTDPGLPKEQPDWRSELLPSIGALFRSGVGSPDENYLLLVSKNPTNPDGEIWLSEVGALNLWYDHGKPITRQFPAGSLYPYLHGLMLNRVMLASNYTRGKSVPGGYVNDEKMTGFAALPRLDYIGERYVWRQPWNFFAAPPPAVGDFPPVAKEGAIPDGGVTWHRQALYMRDALPGGKNYVVLRDTVTGKQPTQWQFWTLSKEIVPVDGKRAGASGGGGDPFAASAPEGVKPTGPVALTGNRFTAKGQFGRDLDYYVASPTDTPRHTIRHGYDAPVSAAVSGFRCEEDLLHLQLPGDGAYFVALVPRSPDEPAPTFATLGDGKVIKVGGLFGADYAFLSDASASTKAEGAAFTGTTASVQDRKDGLVLALGAEGSVAYKDHGIQAATPASLRVDVEALTVNLAASDAESRVTIVAPGGWSVDPSAKGVAVTKPGKSEYQLVIPAKVSQVRLVKSK
ncbi:MAG: hypothetical protein NTW19_12140 [Planctomycetota bacterium]|nr:hypothetical protein [Planctomycetota bacterium]